MDCVSLSASPDLLGRRCPLPPVSDAWTLVGPVAFRYSTMVACCGSIVITWGPGGKSCYGMILTMDTAGGTLNLCLGWHDYCLRGTEQDPCVEETKAVGPKEIGGGARVAGQAK